MFEPIRLLQAPQGYIPGCNTEHREVENVMYQTFKGGRVVFKLNKTTGVAEALVDNRNVGTWKQLTVGDWANVLYTLETEFNHLIEK